MRLIGTISGRSFFAEIGSIRPRPIAVGVVGAAAGFVGAGMAAGVAWAIEVCSVVFVVSAWAIGASISTSATGSTFSASAFASASTHEMVASQWPLFTSLAVWLTLQQ